jgi:hypothetical protein
MSVCPLCRSRLRSGANAVAILKEFGLAPMRDSMVIVNRRVAGKEAPAAALGSAALSHRHAFAMQRVEAGMRACMELRPDRDVLTA